MRKDFSSVDEYLSSFPARIRDRLIELRQLISQNAPAAVESISYGMVGYKLHGRPLLYFGGFKNHVGLFPMAAAITAFAHQLAPFKTGKGSIKLPLDQPLPRPLIEDIVNFRIQFVQKNSAR